MNHKFFKFIFVSSIIAMFSVSCTKDRLYFPPHNERRQISFKDIVINEFVAKGSVNLNEFGSAEDWIELYNKTDSDIYIGDNQLYITDDYPNNPLKYALPSGVIRAKGFLLVWADNEDTVLTEIHSNFKLSSSGEKIGLFWLADTEIITLDTITYGIQTESGVSNARIPDGSDNWGILTVPTPNAPNTD